MPNQTNGLCLSVFLTHLKPTNSDLSSFSLPLVHDGYQEYYSPCGFYFIDHYLHDMNQAPDWLLWSLSLQTLVQYLGNLFSFLRVFPTVLSDIRRDAFC